MDHDPSPPPPPPPRRTAQPTQTGLNKMGRSGNKTLNNGSSESYPQQSRFLSSPTNLMSSQEFKDELKMQQSRLSPSQDAPISIDDKIRLQKQQWQASRSAPQQVLPDSLLSTSTLQRDKRPFAYSPDVSDPKNRGKLDLSYIKSPEMRRRLLANMESSSSGDEIDEERDPYRGSKGENRAESSIPIVSAQSQPALRSFAPTQKSHQLPQQIPTTPIVHYSAGPPTLYTNNQAADSRQNYIIHVPEPVRRQEIVDATMRDPTHSRRPEPARAADLDHEIADSLQSLSLLANNLDESVRLCEKSFAGTQEQRWRSINNNNLPSVSHSLNNQQLRHTSRAEQPQQSLTTAAPATTTSRWGPATVSTFSPTRIIDRRTSPPSFYTVLPSGRQVVGYPEVHNDWSQSANHYGSARGDEPLPNRESTLNRAINVNRHTSQQKTPLNNTNPLDYTSHHQPRATTTTVTTTHSHGTRPSLYNSGGIYDDERRLYDDSMFPQGYLSVSSSMQSPPSRILGTNERQAMYSNQQQVEALNEMTAKLEREVNRLHSLRPTR